MTFLGTEVMGMSSFFLMSFVDFIENRRVVLSTCFRRLLLPSEVVSGCIIEGGKSLKRKNRLELGVVGNNYACVEQSTGASRP